jgi:hypothetical protein
MVKLVLDAFLKYFGLITIQVSPQNVRTQSTPSNSERSQKTSQSYNPSILHFLSKISKSANYCDPRPLFSVSLKDRKIQNPHARHQ